MRRQRAYLFFYLLIIIYIVYSKPNIILCVAIKGGASKALLFKRHISVL
nr:MAG TPA: hypothetical protein [Caudoviricetes sp.]